MWHALRSTANRRPSKKSAVKTCGSKRRADFGQKLRARSFDSFFLRDDFAFRIQEVNDIGVNEIAIGQAFVANAESAGKFRHRITVGGVKTPVRGNVTLGRECGERLGSFAERIDRKNRDIDLFTFSLGVDVLHHVFDIFNDQRARRLTTSEEHGDKPR